MPTGVKPAVRRTYRARPKAGDPVQLSEQDKKPVVQDVQPVTPSPEAVIQAMEHVGEAIGSRAGYANGTGMALDEHIGIHLEERLANYLNALVSSGECNSRNARVRALIIADFAWHGDPDWSNFVADGMKAYYEKYSGG